jgi:A/G-specific adenine glycosylase
MTAQAPDKKADGIWCPPDRLGDHALPTVMKKIVRHAQGG